MTAKQLGLAVLLLSVPALAFGPVESSGELSFVVDSAQYLGDNETLVEVFYQIPNSELTFLAENAEAGPWWATYIVLLELRNDRGQVIYRRNWTKDVQALERRLAESGDSYSLDLIAFEVEPGLYEAMVKIGDPNSEEQRVGEALLPLEVRSLSMPGLGQIQLGSNARVIDEASYTTRPIAAEGLYFGSAEPVASATDDPDGFQAVDSFIKLGYLVIPRPDRRLSPRSAGLAYFYSEVYTLGGRHRLDYEVYNAPGALMTSGSKDVDTTGFDGLVLALDHKSLEPGGYRLVLSLKDSGDNELQREQLAFHIGDTGVVDETPDFPVGDVMTDRELTQILREISFIATEREIRDLAGAPPERRWFLVDRFWARRDPDPTTTVNTAKIEYYNRLAYVRRNFARGASDGLDTPLGRVYMTYGPPDEVSDSPMGTGMLLVNPTEAGYGELEGGLNITGTRGVHHSMLMGPASDTDDRVSGQFSSNLLDLDKPHLLWTYYQPGGDGSQMKFLFVDRTGHGNYTLIWSTERGQY